MEEQDFNLINNATKIEKFKNFFFNNIKKLIAVTILILILMFSYFLLLDMKQKKLKEFLKIITILPLILLRVI